MESPLEVLSRAATMVQDNANESKLSSKELPTTKWRRDRRIRTSEYHSQSLLPYGNCLRIQNDNINGEAPLDMTLSPKPRTPPPPYREPLPGSTYATSSGRPSVITQAPPKKEINTKNILDSISMCDPVIDEHFRRSLGDNYMILFSKHANKNLLNDKEKDDDEINLKIEQNSSTSEDDMNDEENKKSNNSLSNDDDDDEIVKDDEMIEDSECNLKMESEHDDVDDDDDENNKSIDTNSSIPLSSSSSSSIELSVDDHFAKALGDTWKKLQEGNNKVYKTNKLDKKNSSKNSNKDFCNNTELIRPCELNKV